MVAIPEPPSDNVKAIAEMHAQAEQSASHHQRRLERVTALVGRPTFFYGLTLGVVLWICYNVIAPDIGLRRLDAPPFPWLQGVVGLLALLIANVILITQNRQGKLAENRALLDLHVNLLSEQKLAKLIALLEELRRDMPSVANRHDAQAEAMSTPVDPRAAIASLEHTIEQRLERRVEAEIERIEEHQAEEKKEEG